MKLACEVHRFICSLVAAVSLLVVVVHAEQTGFTSTLSPENKSALGLARLSEQQLTTLNAQIAREISVARQGDTVAFSTTFTHRRSPQQRKDAGLDHLMTPELARLDELVAVAVATKPSAIGPTAIQPTTATTSSSDWVDITPRKMEIHGEVTLAYTWGSGGREGFGASVITTATDPSGKFSITLGLAQFRGTGFCYPYGEYPCDRGW